MSSSQRSRGGGGRGGQDGHEPTSRIEARELRAIELAVQGWSQRRIAAELGVSQPAVSKILRRVEDRVLEELVVEGERQKARQTLRLDHVYTESMRAWEQSKADTTRRRQRQTQAGTDRAGTTVAELITATQCGDPRFLEQGRRALADQRALWGLDAPQKLDVRATRNPFDELSEEALSALLGQQRQLLAAGDPGDAKTETPTDEEAPHDDERP